MSHVAIPYPNIQVERQDPQYAKMILSNVGGEDSEMSAVGMYFYGHLVMNTHPELAKTFQQISMDEMRHLEIFGTIALQLGADPRLWTETGRRKKYWSPRFVRYATKPHRALTDALVSEHMAIAKYTKQLKLIRDSCIAENLQRIIQDEHDHIHILTGFLPQV